MYGLPHDFDASVFVGRELESVCFAANSIELSFDQDVSITLQGTFRFRPSTEDDEETCAVPVERSNLMRLVGRVIDRAASAPDGTLILFAGEATLTCVDDSPEYESYQIRLGDREVVV